MIDKHQVFDKFVEEYLIRRRFGAVEYSPGHVSCRYRGDNGTRCVVGMLIKDEDYTPLMEATSINEGRVLEVLQSYGYDAADRAFLSELQALHDRLAGEVLAEKESKAAKLQWVFQFGRFVQKHNLPEPPTHNWTWIVS